MLFTLALAGACASQDPPPAAPRAAVEPGFVVLFDGSSTDAWRGYGSETFPSKGWVVRDGALVHEAGGGGGDLISKRRFGNFDLRFEWKVAPRGNSGVMFRVVETDEPSYVTGPEYQILDDAAHSPSPDTAAGALYRLAAPQGASPRPAGEWNEARIVLVENRLEHWLGGKKVVEVDFASPEYAARLAKSKFASWRGFNAHRRGHICLQDHGDEVAFRNVRIRELPPGKERHGEEVVLFDGTSLDAFDAHLPEGTRLSDVWSIVDGVLVCKGKPAGYLYTRERFESFVLTLEWRFVPEHGGGNSGVLMRMTGEHRVWPRSLEAQLMSGSAGDFYSIGEFPMRAAPERTRGRHTRRLGGQEKPIGEWNRYEIIADGPWVQLAINGEVVNEAWDCAVVPGHICLQSEGVEIHFRAIRLTRLLPP
ncbi:MAG TPA: DUF1080 domain-containing protein [Planctomycetota bacterium]|nr:DUF1080 domain-containing protein [Planctomycetota bacterium]